MQHTGPVPSGRRPTWLGAVLAMLSIAAACGGPTVPSGTPPVAVEASRPAATSTTAPSRAPTPTPQPTPRIVEVDGREQAIDCVGDGSPTVIVEPGLGVPSRMFLTVMADLADTGLRVCRYDRAGMEASDRSTTPRTAEAMAEELRALLAAAGEHPPYILVGHSFGGLIVQLFAREHADEVVGAVFVDAIHPDLDRRLEPMLSGAQVTQRRQELELNDEGIRFDDILSSEAQVREDPPFPPIPIVVLRHGIPFDTTDPDWPAQGVEDLWTELQEDLASLSATSELVVAPKSQHRIMVTEPQLVADAITRVAAQAGQGGAPGG